MKSRSRIYRGRPKKVRTPSVSFIHNHTLQQNQKDYLLLSDWLDCRVDVSTLLADLRQLRACTFLQNADQKPFTFTFLFLTLSEQQCAHPELSYKASVRYENKNLGIIKKFIKLNLKIKEKFAAAKIDSAIRKFKTFAFARGQHLSATRCEGSFK